MGFFQSLKKDLSTAMNELINENEIDNEAPIIPEDDNVFPDGEPLMSNIDDIEDAEEEEILEDGMESKEEDSLEGLLDIDIDKMLDSLSLEDDKPSEEELSDEGFSDEEFSEDETLKEDFSEEELSEVKTSDDDKMIDFGNLDNLEQLTLEDLENGIVSEEPFEEVEAAEVQEAVEEPEVEEEKAEVLTEDTTEDEIVPVEEPVLAEEPVLVEETIADEPVLVEEPATEEPVVEETVIEENVIQETVIEEPVAEELPVEENKESVEEMTEEIKEEVVEIEEDIKEEPVVVTKRVVPEFSDETAIITKGMIITGDVESNGNMDVIGTINGNIDIVGKLNVQGVIKGNSRAHEIFADGADINGEINVSGSAKIGQSSVVIGNVSATSAVIAGAVKGDIDVHGPVVLDSTAIVMGNIKSMSVQINNGAVIEGMCSQCYAEVNPSSFFEEFKKSAKNMK